VWWWWGVMLGGCGVVGGEGIFALVLGNFAEATEALSKACGSPLETACVHQSSKLNS
jgi:hypothetical protein